VFWYHKNDILKEWVILKPDLAVDAVYMLIDDNEIQVNLGSVYYKDFARLWVNEHHKAHHAILKEMLKEFRVAFPKRHNSHDYILPVRLESMPREKEWTEPASIIVEYNFSFMMPKAIVNQLSAELSRYILIDSHGNEEVWNNAVNFSYENHTDCQVKEEYHNRKITIKAKGRDARGLIILVKNALDDIASAYKGVKPEITVACICFECLVAVENKTYYKYNDLVRWSSEKGREKARCNESGEDIPIEELLANTGSVYIIDKDREGMSNQMKKINIFLASSNELEVERNEFEIFINRENKRLIDYGIFLNLVVWEDFIDAMSKTRLQDEYNKAVRGSDIFISLFFTKAGMYTQEEFEAAFGQFEATNKPLVYTYFKDADVKTGNLDEAFLSLLRFKDRVKELGHYPTQYSNVEDLKNKFKSQLEKLLKEGLI